MIENQILEKKLSNYLEEGKKGNFRFTSLSSPILFDDENKSCEVELFRVGSWQHPQAEGGLFSITKERIINWIKNFKERICGPELPLDFGHRQDSRETPGWISDLYEKVMNGVPSLWASLRITEPTTWEKIRNGSLRYISPRVCSEYVEPSSGKGYDVIRDASLTNYPYLKNLEPIAVNFEEIMNERKVDKMDEEKNKYEEEELELDEEEESEEEELEEDAEFAEKGYGFTPKGAKKAYGVTPRIKLPAEVKKLSKTGRKAFLVAFNKAYRRVKNEAKAIKIALRKTKSYGFKLEEPMEEKKGLMSKFEEFLTGLKGEKETKEPEVSLEEVMEEMESLKAFKRNTELEEDKRIVGEMANATPALKSIIQTLLDSRGVEVEFEEKKLSMRDLIVKLIEELKNVPAVNLFEKKSDNENAISLSANLAEKALAYQKEHPDVTLKEATREVYKQSNQK